MQPDDVCGWEQLGQLIKYGHTHTDEEEEKENREAGAYRSAVEEEKILFWSG